MAFRLTKNLPVASGIGGGSSDAAAAMRLLVKYNRLAIDAEGLRDIGAILGADIPVCLYAQAARMRGTGLRLDPVRSLPEIPLVLVNPGVAVTTADVFRERQGPFSQSTRWPLPVNASVTGLAVWLDQSRNDLFEPARHFAPIVDEVLDALGSYDGALLTRMSGSGATCFGIFNDTKRAEHAAAQLSSQYPQWWVVSTVARN